MRRKKNNTRGGGEAEVEELLKAAEDELLLNLRINSHTTNVDLDSNLLHRFQALKIKSPSIPVPPPLTSTSRVQLPTPSPLPEQQTGGEKGENDESEKILLGEDLSTRFAALKNKNKPSASTFVSTEIESGFSMEGNYDENDEVEKLIQWAMDAARLDPSPPTDDEDDDDNDDYDLDEDDCEKEDGSDDDDDDDTSKKKAHTKKKASVFRINKKRR